MQMRDFVSSGSLANRGGVKALVYGPPGSGKTPVIQTAPRPCLLSCELGMLSMQGTNLPTKQALKWKDVVDFLDWAEKSAERKNFDTICIDSASEMAEIHLRDNPGKHSHGMQQYGKMQEDVYERLYNLFALPDCNIYIICKQMVEQSDAGAKLVPYFPGKALNVSVPHLFDEVWHLDMQSIPGAGAHRAFHCHSGFGKACRDRSGRLAEFEPPNLTTLFAKCLNKGS